MQIPKIRPSGVGVWIWQLKKTEGGDLAKIVSRCKQAGVRYVLLKTGDTEPGWPAAKMWNGWQDAARYIRNAGIEVRGWAYVSTINPLAESNMVLDSLAQEADGKPLLSGFILNGEGYEERDGGHDAQVRTLGQLIRAEQPEVWIEFTGWTYASLHSAYPNKAFSEFCDANCPEDYWSQWNISPEMALERARIDYEKSIRGDLLAKNCKLSAAGLIHSVTPDELRRFLASKDIDGTASLWVWEYANQLLWDAVEAHTRGEPAPLPDRIVTVKGAQIALNMLGFDCGTPDGDAGEKTQNAIRRYQKIRGLSNTGKLDSGTIGRLSKEPGVVFQ